MNLFSAHIQQTKRNALHAMGLQGSPDRAVKLRGKSKAAMGRSCALQSRGRK